MESALEIKTEELSVLFPTDRGSGLEYVEWQTWPFNGDQPRIGWSCGICEAFEFYTNIKPTLIDMGQKPFWREISTAAQ